MEKTQLYESPEISVLEIAGEQAFATSYNIEKLTVEEEEW